MSGDETTRVDQWLRTTLAADATLTSLVSTRIYSERAPQSATFPFVLFQFQGGSDVMGAGATRIMLDGVWVVRGVVKGNSFNQDSLKSIADRIDILLHRSSGGVADGTTVFTSTREAPFRLAEDRDGVSYRHLGGRFRILAQSA